MTVCCVVHKSVLSQHHHTPISIDSTCMLQHYAVSVDQIESKWKICGLGHPDRFLGIG